MSSKLERVGIVGYGIVGQTVAHLFKKVVIYDPPKGWNDPLALGGCPVIFICLPTPTIDGRNDLGTILSTLDVLAPYLAPECILAIRSTVLPGTTRRLQQEYQGLHFASNPEFLRGHLAFHDVLNPYRIIIGADTPWVGQYLEQFYQSRLGNKVPVVVTDSVTAEVIKYASNSFLAMKISFAEELRELCQKLGVEYGMVAEGMAFDPRIGGGEELFRGDGNRGFTDECLPKDLESFVTFVQEWGHPGTMLKATQAVNTRILSGSKRTQAVKLQD